MIEMRHLFLTKSVICTLVFAFAITVPLSSGLQVLRSEQTIPGYGSIQYSPPQRLHTEGRWIKDSRGNIVRLVGAARHRGIEDSPDPLSSPSQKEGIYDLLAASGANSIRLSLNREYWFNNPSTYRVAVDIIVGWCKERQIWVTLDYHAGFPGDAGTSWSNVDSWKEFMVSLAQHYVNEPMVIGFDIWNEPKGDFSSYRTNVLQVIRAIHGVDSNYIVFVEPTGSSAEGDDLQNFVSDPLPEPNVVYNFHRYYGWDYPWYDYAISYGNGNFEIGYSQMEALYYEVAFDVLDAGYPVCLSETGTQFEEYAPNSLKQMDDLYKLLEKYQVSVWHWSFDNSYPPPSKYMLLLTDDLAQLSPSGQIFSEWALLNH